MLARRQLALSLVALTLVACGGAYASRARTRYVASHGGLPQPSEIRVDDFLADYPESVADPAPHAAGVSVEGARAAWAAESSEPLFVVQTVVRGRNPDVRPPMAMMFVVDRSGSMQEEDKMTYVRQALHRLVEQLDPRDRVGVAAFDDYAEVILPVTSVSEGEALHAAIDRLQPRGATNLSHGLQVGYAALAQEPTTHLRRVVLLTDAVANVGDTDLHRIGGWAARGDADGIRLSAIGVGLGHRDDVLVEMSRQGRGNHYFLDSPDEIERVFAREAAGLLEDVADGVHVTFTPAPGVQVVRVEGATAQARGPHWQADVGRLGAAQHRTVLWTLRGVDPLDRTPTVGRFTLDFTDMRANEPRRVENAQPVFVVTDVAEGTVARNSAVAWMARDLKRVAELAQRGSYAEAQGRLDRVRAVVGAVSAARPADRELQRDLGMLEDLAEALARRTGQPVRRFRASIRVDVEG